MDRVESSSVEGILMENLRAAMGEGLCRENLELKTQIISLLRAQQAQSGERPGHKLLPLFSADNQSASWSLGYKEKRLR